jgi:hypothetical protein
MPIGVNSKGEIVRPPGAQRPKPMPGTVLDMSILVDGWWPHEDIMPSVHLNADRSRPITLDFKATDVEPSALGKTLIMQARVGVQELWGIRMLPSGRLLIQPGTGPSRETRYGYPGELVMGLSFNPVSGAFSVTVADPGEIAAAEIFNLNIRTPWATPDEGYEILLGAPEGYADRSPFGWRFYCSFRYGPVEQQAEDPVLGAEEPRRDEHSGLAQLNAINEEILSIRKAWAEAVQDLDNERHWEAMLALVNHPGCDPSLFDPQWLAGRAAELVDAHNTWKEGR